MSFLEVAGDACRPCGGRGWTGNGTTCPNCEGTGVVQVAR